MHPDRFQQNRRPTLAALVPLLALSCSVGGARAQTSANLTLLSAYTARGVTLDARPTPQLRVEYDAQGDAQDSAAAGWYAGGFASRVHLDGRSQAQLIVYGGRAQRITSTLTLDAGVSHSAFSRDGSLGYNEVYAGLMVRSTSARVFYSPGYYGEARTLYLDLNTAYPLTEKLGLALHAGVLHPYSEYGYPARNAHDVRVGLATDIGDYRLQAGWQRTWHSYYLRGAPAARALTASVSLYF